MCNLVCQWTHHHKILIWENYVVLQQHDVEKEKTTPLHYIFSAPHGASLPTSKLHCQSWVRTQQDWPNQKIRVLQCSWDRLQPKLHSSILNSLLNWNTAARFSKYRRWNVLVHTKTPCLTTMIRLGHCIIISSSTITTKAWGAYQPSCLLAMVVLSSLLAHTPCQGSSAEETLLRLCGKGNMPVHIVSRDSLQVVDYSLPTGVMLKVILIRRLSQ